MFILLLAKGFGWTLVAAGRCQNICHDDPRTLSQLPEGGKYHLSSSVDGAPKEKERKSFNTLLFLKNRSSKTCVYIQETTSSSSHSNYASSPSGAEEEVGRYYYRATKSDQGRGWSGWAVCLRRPQFVSRFLQIVNI